MVCARIFGCNVDCPRSWTIVGTGSTFSSHSIGLHCCSLADARASRRLPRTVAVTAVKILPWSRANQRAGISLEGKRFSSPCASAIQIVRPLESIAETRATSKSRNAASNKKPPRGQVWRLIVKYCCLRIVDHLGRRVARFKLGAHFL